MSQYRDRSLRQALQFIRNKRLTCLLLKKVRVGQEYQFESAVEFVVRTVLKLRDDVDD